MTTRTRYTVEFSYPGALFAETITREVEAPTLSAVIAAAPSETDGYFTADGWYAATVREVIEKRFVADDGEETWQRQSATKIRSWVVGEKIHVDDIEDTPRNRILRSNIKGNTTDGYGVLTRSGNWQLASDYDDVLSPQAVSA